MAKKEKKYTKKQRKEIFLSSCCYMVGPFTDIQSMMSIVGTVLYPAIPVSNVSEIR